MTRYEGDYGTVWGDLWHSIGGIMTQCEGIYDTVRCKMSLLGWVVGAALLDEWGRREEEEREKEELRRKNWENERRIRDLETRLGRIEGNRF